MVLKAIEAADCGQQSARPWTKLNVFSLYINILVYFVVVFKIVLKNYSWQEDIQNMGHLLQLFLWCVGAHDTAQEVEMGNQTPLFIYNSQYERLHHLMMGAVN